MGITSDLITYGSGGGGGGGGGGGSVPLGSRKSDLGVIGTQTGAKECKIFSAGYYADG